MAIKLGERRFTTFLAIFLPLALLAFGSTILSPGVVCCYHDWSIPPYSQQLARFTKILFSGFSEDDLGSRRILTSYWLDLPVGMLSSLGLNGEHVSKGILVFTFSLSGFAMYYAAVRRGLGTVSSIVSAIFYMSAPVYFNKAVAGHIYFLLSYAFAPLAVHFFCLTLAEKNVRGLVRGVALSSVMLSISGGQIQYFGMLFLLMFLLAISVRSFLPAMRNLALLSAIASIAFVLNPSWIFNLLNIADSSRYVGVLVGKGSIFTVSYNSDLVKAFHLTGYVGDAFENSVRTNNLNFWYIASLLLICVGFSSIFLAKGSRRLVIVLVATALVSIVFANGTSSEIGRILWTFAYDRLTPVAAIYSEVYNIMGLAALCYAFLLGLGLQAFLARVKRNPRLGKLGVSVAILICLTTFAYAYPSYTMYGSNLQTYVWNESYRDVYDRLANEPGYFRVLWLPTIAYGMTYQSLKLAGIDPMISYSPKPAFPQLEGTAYLQPYSRGFSAFNEFVLDSVSPYTDAGGPQEAKTRYVGQTLSLIGIRYVVLRSDAYTYARFQVQYNVSRTILENQVGLEETYQTGPITIYKNDEVLPILYLSNVSESALLSGPLNALTSLDYAVQDGKIMSQQRAFFAVAQLDRREVSLLKGAVRNYITTFDDYYDTVVATVPQFHKLFPVNHTGSATSLGWYPVESSTDFYGSVLSLPPNQTAPSRMRIPFAAPVSGPYELWAKIHFTPQSSRLSFIVDDAWNRTVNTKSNAAAFKWVRYGNLELGEGVHSVTLWGFGWERIPMVVIAPQKVFEEARSEAAALLAEKSIVLLQESEKADSMERWRAQKIGSEASQGSLIESMGSSASALYSLYVPASGEYTFQVRAASSNPANVSLTLKRAGGANVYSKQIALPEDRRFHWYRLDLPALGEGEYVLEVAGSRPGIRLDMMALYHFKPSEGVDVSSMLVRKYSPTHYEVDTRTSSHAFLVFSSHYDRSWRTLVNGVEKVPVVVNGFTMAYPLSPGEYRISLVYEQQRVMEAAWLVTLSCLATLVSAVVIVEHRERRKVQGSLAPRNRIQPN